MTRILVAEDDAHLLRVLTMWLERNGFEVIQAPNGRVALEHFRRHQPRLLITDVNMPEMTGIELVQAVLNEARQPVGAIILSCRVDVIGIDQTLGDGNVIHHAKPFSPSRLIQEVRHLLESLDHKAPVSAPGSGGQSP